MRRVSLRNSAIYLCKEQERSCLITQPQQKFCIRATIFQDSGYIRETIPLLSDNRLHNEGLSGGAGNLSEKGYTYIRTRNPNRTALGEVLSCLEGGEASLILPPAWAPSPARSWRS